MKKIIEEFKSAFSREDNPLLYDAMLNFLSRQEERFKKALTALEDKMQEQEYKVMEALEKEYLKEKEEITEILDKSL